MIKQIGWLALVVIALAGNSSCSLLKRGKRTQPATDTAAVTVLPADTIRADTVPVAAGISPEKQALIDALTTLWTRDLSFTTFSGKAKMHYEGKGEKQEFTAHFRVRKDSLIWVSVTAVGGIVQVARVLITPDSFRLINYLDKEVSFMSLQQAAARLPVPADLKTIQNLVIGGPLSRSGNPSDAREEGDLLSLMLQDSILSQMAMYSRKDSTLRSLQMKTEDPGGPQALIQLDEYENVDGMNFSTMRTIHMGNKGEQFYLDMKFGNLNFDQPLEFPFSVPKNYKRK